MKVGLLVIGSEVLEGKVADANTRALAEFLALHQLQLEMNLTVRDQELAIHQGLKFLLDRCDVVLTSGGLGPTKDDITKAAIGSFMDKAIVYSSEAHQVAEANYARMSRHFPGKDHGYCWVPEGFISLNNSTGFAPGLFAQYHDKFVLSGAGVPREFKSLLHDHFIPLLGPQLPQLYRHNFTAKTRRVPEEKIFSEIDPTLWEKLEDFGEVSSLPNLLGVDIGVSLNAGSLAELDQKKIKLTEIFEKSPVKDIIWQYGSLSLEEFIVKRATELKLTFGFAESCTGGLCSHRITSVSGSSACFMGSVVSYDNSVKKNLLGVAEEVLTTLGPVSEKSALQMAQGLRSKLKVDIAISITGIAGPSGGTVENPVGSFWVGKASSSSQAAEKFIYPGDRELLKNRFSQAALFTLLDEIEKFA